MAKEEKIFYKLALSRNYITKSQIVDVLDRQANAPDEHIIKIISDHGYMSPEEIIHCLELVERRLDRQGKRALLLKQEKEILESLLRRGLVSQERIELYRQEQQRRNSNGFVSVDLLLLKGGEVDFSDYVDCLAVNAPANIKRPVVDTVPLTCPFCNRKYKLPLSAIGRRFRCKHCQKILPDVQLNDNGSIQAAASSPAAAADVAREIPTEGARQKTTQTQPKRDHLKVDPHHRIDGDVDLESDYEIVEFGNYEIISEIARGAMGIIYKARQKNLNRIVALKVLREGHKASKGAILRFQREAEAAGGLTHPNIVAIHEWGTVDGVPYFSMDYITGDPLDVLIRKRALSLVRGLEIMEEIARAVHFAHINGVVHRDLKPANIIIDKHNVPKITDFGLAKTADFHGKLTQSGYAIGTPFYMSPEQARGDLKRIGPRSDVYNLGVIFYEILTRRVPFTGKTNIEIYEKIEYQDPPLPSLYNRKVSRDLETICLKAMEKDPAMRYRSALEFAEDIRRYLDGDAITARPVGIFARLAKRFKKHRMTVVVSVLVLVLSLTLSLLLPSPSKPSAPLPAVNTNQPEAVKKVQHAMQKGAFAKALEIINQALQQSSTRDLVLWRGLVHYFSGRYVEAVVDFKKGLQGDLPSSLPITLILRAKLYKGASYMRCCQLEQAQATLQQALDACRRTLHNLPAGPQQRELRDLQNVMRYYYGEVHACQERYAEALSFCSKAAQAHPQYFMALLSSAILKIKLYPANANTPQITQALNQAKELYCDSRWPYHWLAYIYLMQGHQTRNALEEYKEFLSRNPALYFQWHPTAQQEEFVYHGTLYPVTGLRQLHALPVGFLLEYVTAGSLESREDLLSLASSLRHSLPRWQHALEYNACLVMAAYFSQDYRLLAERWCQLKRDYQKTTQTFGQCIAALADKQPKQAQEFQQLLEQAQHACNEFLACAHLFQALAFYRQHKYQQTLTLLQQPYQGSASTRQYLELLELWTRYRLDHKEQVFWHAMENYAQQADAAIQPHVKLSQAYILLKMRRYDQVISCLNSLILEHANAYAYLLRGQAYRLKQVMSQARSDFTKAQQANPLLAHWENWKKWIKGS